MTTPDLLENSNCQCAHQGRYCFGKTPMQTFLDARPMSQEKQMSA